VIAISMHGNHVFKGCLGDFGFHEEIIENELNWKCSNIFDPDGGHFEVRVV